MMLGIGAIRSTFTAAIYITPFHACVAGRSHAAHLQRPHNHALIREGSLCGWLTDRQALDHPTRLRILERLATERRGNLA
jgi:hypothetical protein